MDDDTKLGKPLVIAALLALAFVCVSGWDFEDELVRDAIRKDPPKFFPAALVIPYDAQVCQDSGGKRRCKWYVSGATKQEIKR